MAKKAVKQISKANLFYIKENMTLSPEVLADHTGLDIGVVESELKKLSKKPQKGIKLTKSKIVLDSGAAIYQMTDELDTKPRGAKKISKEQDERAGIYRSPK